VITIEEINKKILKALPPDYRIRLIGETDVYSELMTGKERLRTYNNEGEYTPFVWETSWDFQSFHMIGDIEFDTNNKILRGQSADYKYVFVVSSNDIELINNAIRALTNFQDVHLERITRSSNDVYDKYWKISDKNKDDKKPYQFTAYAIEYKITGVSFSGRCINPCGVIEQNKLC